MTNHLWPSLGILVAFGLVALDRVALLAVASAEPHLQQHHQHQHQLSGTGGVQGRLLDKCCQVGREKAIESAKFNCKLSARDALVTGSQSSPDLTSNSDRSGANLLALSADALLSRDQNFGDQCEMVLESCCLAFHRTRNCDSGKQFAKSGTSCMDVELSKEASLATESFNDCCMSCSLGILAARNPPSGQQQQQNDSLRALASDRCRLISPLASSLSGQLYEQTYTECCQENLPRPSGALHEPGAPIDCNQANACSQRCLASGSLDPITRRTITQDRCDCFSGFKLASDEVTCVDVDECKTNLHTCNRQTELCDNTRGSFRCLARSSQQMAGPVASIQSRSPNSASNNQHHHERHHFSNFHQTHHQQHHSHHHHHQQQQQQVHHHQPANVHELGAANTAEPIEQPFASLRLRPPRW